MQNTSLAVLLARSTPYSKWAAPIDRRVVNGMLFSGATSLLVVLGLALQQPLISMLDSGILYAFSGILTTVLRLFGHFGNVIAVVNLVNLAIGCIVLWLVPEEGYTSRYLHWAAFTVVIVGVVQGPFLSIFLAVVGLNLLMGSVWGLLNLAFNIVSAVLGFILGIIFAVISAIIGPIINAIMGPLFGLFVFIMLIRAMSD